MKKIKVGGKEMQSPMEAINQISLTIGKRSVCSRCGKEKKIVLSALQGDLNDLKQLNICQDCWSLKQVEDFIGKKGVEKLMKEWEDKLQKLELNTLSVAKYFYEKWKINDPAIMQRLIYFAYLEILKEEDIALFEEKFQAWPGGPVLESVFYPMYENCEDLESFFANVDDVNNTIVLQYLEKIAKKYHRWENSRIHQEARNELWRETRSGLTNEGETKPIDEVNIFSFIRQNRGKSIHSL